jgi:N-acetylmuramoyl-L-alanine amidase
MLILSEPRATYKQCELWLSSKSTAHPLAVGLLPILWDSAIKNGIDPCILITQAMKETGYFNYKGVLRPNFCNTCGLKTTKGGSDYAPNAHMRFEYWEDGIMAHSDHLALYAGASNMPKYSPECATHTNKKYKKNGTTLDPRHFTYLLGTAKHVEDLGGKWSPNKKYGDDIVKMVNEIINTKIPVDEVDNLIINININ